MREYRLVDSGKIVHPTKTCPNPDCNKSVSRHTIQEARDCKGIALRDAGNC